MRSISEISNDIDSKQSELQSHKSAIERIEGELILLNHEYVARRDYEFSKITQEKEAETKKLYERKS